MLANIRIWHLFQSLKGKSLRRDKLREERDEGDAGDMSLDGL